MTTEAPVASPVPAPVTTTVRQPRGPRRWISKVTAITGREITGYLVSPAAYISSAGFLAISGYLFSAILTVWHSSSLTGWFAQSAIVFLFVAPIFTMRLIAEERRQKTWALLMTSPVSATQIVLGKFLAGVSLTWCLILATGVFPYILHLLDGRPDWGPIAAGYLGFALLAAALVAIGLFASSLTENVLVAAVIGYTFNMFFWMIGWSEVHEPGWREILKALSLLKPHETFSRGVIEIKDLCYYASVIFLFLFAAVRVLETRKWSSDGR